MRVRSKSAGAVKKFNYGAGAVLRGAGAGAVGKKMLVRVRVRLRLLFFLVRLRFCKGAGAVWGCGLWCGFKSISRFFVKNINI